MCVCYIHLCRYLKQRKASDPIFVSFTEQRRGAERHTLESLLRLPISRIWEYDKLIWQLMAVTSECHPDFPNLKEVSVKLHAVCLLQHSSGVHCSFVWPVSCSFIQMVQCREDAIKFAENEVYSLAELMDYWDVLATVCCQEVWMVFVFLCIFAEQAHSSTVTLSTRLPSSQRANGFTACRELGRWCRWSCMTVACVLSCRYLLSRRTSLFLVVRHWLPKLQGLETIKGLTNLMVVVAWPRLAMPRESLQGCISMKGLWHLFRYASMF